MVLEDDVVVLFWGENKIVQDRRRQSSVLVCGFVFLGCVFCFCMRVGFAQEQIHAVETLSSKLVSVQGEILEVAARKVPEGSAILTVKDFASGKTLQLFADPHRVSVRAGTELKTVSDVLPGSKATIIYQEEAGKDMFDAVFIKISGSY